MSEPTLPTPEQIRHAAERVARYSGDEVDKIAAAIQPAAIVRGLCRACKIESRTNHTNPAQHLAERLNIDHETAVAIYLAYAPELYLALAGGQS